MCRHLAYLGPPATLRALLLDPPHGLGTQAWAPRRQWHGTMNVDGFGVGWYAEGDPVPARYRQAGPIWADPSLADLARVTRTRALLAAVRSATDGTDRGAAAAAPYAIGRWPAARGSAGAGGALRFGAGLGADHGPAAGGRAGRHRAGRGDRRPARPRRHRPVQLPAHRRPGHHRDRGRRHPVLPGGRAGGGGGVRTRR